MQRIRRNLIFVVLCYLCPDLYSQVQTDIVQAYAKKELENNNLILSGIQQMSHPLISKHLPSHALYTVTVLEDVVIAGPGVWEATLAVDAQGKMAFIKDIQTFLSNSIAPVENRQTALEIALLYAELCHFKVVESPSEVRARCNDKFPPQPHEDRVKRPGIIFKKNSGYTVTFYAVVDSAICQIDRIRLAISKTGAITIEHKTVCARSAYI